jgi:hypothetical protein
MDNLVFYQHKMEQFYNDLVDTMIQNRSCLWVEGAEFEEFIDDHDLLVFEDTLRAMPYDDSNEAMLRCMIKKGYEIVMNSQEKDVLLGNVVVKLGDKWFAFGQCRNDVDEGLVISELWPLKYVLPRLNQNQVKLKHFFPIDSEH